MLEIRSAGAKGFGVFATQPIARGTRILAERPLLAVRRERDIYAAARQLTPDQHATLQQLSINPIRRSDALGWTFAVWHAIRHGLPTYPHRSNNDDHLSSSSSSYSSSSTRLSPLSLLRALRAWPSAIAAHLQLREIFRNNNFDIGDGDGSGSSGDRQAVFARTSRVNHACVPSAQGNFHAGLGAFTLHALCDLRVGDEITVSYLVERAGVRAARQRALWEGYGFLCDCAVCDENSARGQLSEERRVGMRERLKAFAEREEGGTRGGEGKEKDVTAELEVTEALIGLFELEGIRGRELATMCISAAEMYAKLERREEAKALAEKGLMLEKECVGVDSPFFQESAERVRSRIEQTA